MSYNNTKTAIPLILGIVILIFIIPHPSPIFAINNSTNVGNPTYPQISNDLHNFLLAKQQQRDAQKLMAIHEQKMISEHKELFLKYSLPTLNQSLSMQQSKLEQAKQSMFDDQYWRTSAKHDGAVLAIHFSGIKLQHYFSEPKNQIPLYANCPAWHICNGSLTNATK